MRLPLYKSGCERIFVFSRDAGGPGATVFRGESHCQDRRGVAVLPATVKREVRASPNGL
jgi:hypothetical protein